MTISPTHRAAHALVTRRERRHDGRVAKLTPDRNPDFTPVFLNDWTRVLFIHYAIEPARLQPFVPFALDTRDGDAFVSLVAFTIERLRPAFAPQLGLWLLAPISAHQFLNLRTYMHHNGAPGIYFLAEFLNNRLSVMLGPITYGLPYRFGRICYEHHHERGVLEGRVVAGAGVEFAYRARLPRDARFRPSEPDSREAFLLERYTAFTMRRSFRRLFHIAHTPWLQTTVNVTVTDDSLIRSCAPWFRAARHVGANYSPGARDILVGPPERIDRAGARGGPS